VQQYVCSEQCPCPAGTDGATKTLWESYNETDFTKWNRTKSETVTEEQKT